METSHQPQSLSGPRLEALRMALLDWFGRAQREMPWRGTPDAYAIWVSEVMLQQTQVATVIPYYLRFMQRFPSLEALALAPLDDVLSLWKGLGYYARARNLHRGALYVLTHHQGQIPDTLEAILRVPGVGRYTAGAILSIAFGKRVPLLDGNVARVLCRLHGVDETPSSSRGQHLLWSLAETLVPASRPGEFNQALMELGALVCTPAQPSCRTCPLSTFCVAVTLPDPTVFPRRAARRPVPEAEAVALVIGDEKGWLFARRPPQRLLGGLWEFPMTRLRPNETIEEAALRLAETHLKRPVTIAASGFFVEHIFTHLKLCLHVRRASIAPRETPCPPLPPRTEAEKTAATPSTRRGGAAELDASYEAFQYVDETNVGALPTGRATQRVLEQLRKTDQAQLLMF